MFKPKAVTIDKMLKVFDEHLFDQFVVGDGQDRLGSDKNAV